jgi:hypothetical protein
VEEELDRRVIAEDLKRGMRMMNERMQEKFREQEDLKEQMQDTFTYLKLYLPVKTYQQINESMTYLVRDCFRNNTDIIDKQRFIFNQASRFESLMKSIDLAKQKMLEPVNLDLSPFEIRLSAERARAYQEKSQKLLQR